VFWSHHIIHSLIRGGMTILPSHAKRLLPKPQPAAHFYELGLVEDGV